MLREATSQPVLISMVLISGVSSFLIGSGIQPQMPEFAIDLGMNQAGLGYGLLLAASSAGAVLGGIILESTHWLKPSVRVAMISTLVWAACLLGFAVSQQYAVALLLLVGAGMANLASQSTAQTLVQLLAPARKARTHRWRLHHGQQRAAGRQWIEHRPGRWSDWDSLVAGSERADALGSCRRADLGHRAVGGGQPRDRGTTLCMNAVARALRARSSVPPGGEVALRDALGVWERRLRRERVGTWLIRGAGVALLAVCLVLLVGWVTPIPESDLHPWAAGVAFVPLLAAAAYALVPRRHIRHAAELDLRLGLGDRLATAWSFRGAEDLVVRLQRNDALLRLSEGAPERDLRWRPARRELVMVGGALLVSLLLLMTPSPQQRVLDQQAAEQNSVQQASQQLDVLRQAADASNTLTPDQARQLNELLQQAQSDLNHTHSQQAASAILARTQDQLNQQLGDPNADLRDEALAAMSETLAAEPQTQALASALQQENAQATSDAIRDISSKADSLSDVERQALSRALQRASNVGRSDTSSSSALANAAQAVASGQSTDAAMSQMDAALRDSIQASQSQAAVDATAQQLHDLQTRLASGAPLTSPARPDTPAGLRCQRRRRGTCRRHTRRPRRRRGSVRFRTGGGSQRPGRGGWRGCELGDRPGAAGCPGCRKRLRSGSRRKCPRGPGRGQSAFFGDRRAAAVS